MALTKRIGGVRLLEVLAFAALTVAAVATVALAQEGGPPPGMPAPAVVAAEAAPPTIDLDNLGTLVLTPYGLSLVVGALVYGLLEIIKGLSRKVASWTAMRKRALSVLAGLALGLVFGLCAGVPYAWWIAVIAGGAGAGGFSMVRGVGQGMRRLPSRRGGPWTSAIVGLLALCLPGCVKLDAQVRADAVKVATIYEVYVAAQAPAHADPVTWKADRIALSKQFVEVTGSTWASWSWRDVAVTITCFVERAAAHDPAVTPGGLAALKETTRGIRVKTKLPADCPVAGGGVP